MPAAAASLPAPAAVVPQAAFALAREAGSTATVTTFGTATKTPHPVVPGQRRRPQPASRGAAAAAAQHGVAVLAAASATLAACQGKRRQRRLRFAGGGRHVAVPHVARRYTELKVEVPDVEDLERVEEAFLGDVSASVAAAIQGVAAQLQGLAAQLRLPEPPAALSEAIAAAAAAPEFRSAAAALEAQAGALTAALPVELAAVLADPALATAAQPAAAGALLVLLLAIRRGRQQWVEELPLRYDGPWIEAYWQRRPLKLMTRFVEVAIKVGAFSTAVELDKAFGKLDENMPQRAVEARELITDLGPTFVKITQVWASRPDVLPEPYQKECEKLLEQVRPFGKEDAMLTLRRNITGEGAIERTFDDMSAFDEPVASASVGQVYKAKVDGREVAVKVQRPDVREQVTLDLFVVRRLAGIGSYAPIERYARQFQSLLELVDRAAPPFIEELDYENEADNQRKFARTIANCDLVKDTVVVPEVILSSREVLVQEWLPGKKLTEPGAARDQADRVVKVLLNSYMVQFLETGFLHGDPHPGNFVLMPSGKLGILDYGLMTTIEPEKRVAFIEYIMHVQAKMYDACLQDLINLEFLPQGIADDKEAREVIVPGLANTLSIIYEGSADLREQQKKFEKQREDLKATGKLEVLRSKLQAIAKKYGSFRLPGYMTLILRAFITLEGVGLKTDKSFSIVKECFPYVARRLLTDDSLRIREALKAYLYKDRKRVQVSRIDDLASGFGNFTSVMKGSQEEAIEAGAPIPTVAIQETKGTSHNEAPGEVKIDVASKDIAAVIFSPDGNFLQELLIDEAVAAIDALSRATLVQILRTLGPFAGPLKQRLNFVLGASDYSRTEQVILTREDKESLLLLRRIVQLLQGRGASPEDTAESEQSARPVNAINVVRELRRLGPLASGLLPAVAPGATAFARRLIVQLSSRTLLRLAQDLERGAGGSAARAVMAAAQ